MQSGVIGIGPRAHSSAHPSLPAAPVLPCTTLGETLRHAAHQLGQVAQLLAMCRLAIPGQELRHALLELGLREHTVLGEVFLLACGEVLARGLGAAWPTQSRSGSGLRCSALIYTTTVSIHKVHM